jgi:hypothetical protein
MALAQIRPLLIRIFYVILDLFLYSTCSMTSLKPRLNTGKAKPDVLQAMLFSDALSQR